MHDQLITSHCLLDKTRNKKNNGFYLHYMNTSSPSYILIKQKRKKKKILFEDQKLWQVMHQNLAKFTKLQEQKLKTLPNKCLLFKMLKKHCSNLLADLEAYLLIIEIDQKILELTF